MRRQVRIVARGTVQGVGFRYYVRHWALELGLDGDVSNRSDGGVEVRAAGDGEAILALIQKVREGPSSADVTEVEVAWEQGPRPAPGFRITGRPGVHGTP